MLSQNHCMKWDVQGVAIECEDLRIAVVINCFERRKQYTVCPRRNVQYFGRVFLRSNYTDITQNTYIQSSMVTEILAGEV